MTPLDETMRDAILDAYAAGLAAADPTVIVRRAVRQGFLDDWLLPPGTPREKPKSIRVLALGKAAPRMLWGLVEAGVPFGGLGVAPRGVPAPNVDTFQWLPSDHPIPGGHSFAAGQAVLQWVRTLADDAPVLVLLSGGASACVEAPVDGLSTNDLQTQWKQLLRSGASIEDMNRERTTWSRLKGGKLGQALLERTGRVRCWLLADTEPALAPATVGSGPLWQAHDPAAVPHRVLAANDAMVVAAGLRLASLGYDVHRHGRRVAGPAEREVDAFLTAARGIRATGKPIALVGGGEATVAVPDGAPVGGRAQHAALLAARWLHQAGDEATAFACLASDGIDGDTDAAGAVVQAADGAAPEAAQAAQDFDAHRFLAGRDRLVHMGPTGTNVNDLWIALRP